jgi:tetratricopeptide (TPR) repeat protein
MEVLLSECVTAQTIPVPDTDAATCLAEADRLLEQGHQQLDRNLALQFYQQALELYRDPSVQTAFPQESRQGEGAALINLGNTYADLRQYEQAIDLYEQSLTIARELGNPSQVAKVLQKIGAVYQRQRSWDEADSAYEEALSIYREIGDRISEADLLVDIVSGYSNNAQLPRNIDLLQEATQIYRVAGYQSKEAETWYILGQLYRLHAVEILNLITRTTEQQEQSTHYHLLAI